MAAKGRVAKAERSCAATKKRTTDLKGKLGDAEMRLTQAESVISTRDKEVVDLKVAMRKVKINSTIWDLLMPRTPVSPSCLNLGAMGLERGGWLL